MGVTILSVEQKIDLKDRTGNKPVFEVVAWRAVQYLDYNSATMRISGLQQNTILRFDDWFSLNIAGAQEDFYTVTPGKTYTGPRGNIKYPDMLFSYALSLDAVSANYERRVYNMLDLLSEFGGIQRAAIVIFMVLIGPI